MYIYFMSQGYPFFKDRTILPYCVEQIPKVMFMTLGNSLNTYSNIVHSVQDVEHILF